MSSAETALSGWSLIEYFTYCVRPFVCTLSIIDVPKVRSKLFDESQFVDSGLIDPFISVSVTLL